VRVLLHIISVMESLVKKKKLIKGDLVKFITVLQGTHFDRITGRLGVVTFVKGDRVDVVICDIKLEGMHAGCFEKVDQRAAS